MRATIRPRAILTKVHRAKVSTMTKGRIVASTDFDFIL